MHFHILGICGTFMGSLALLLKEKGHQVSGCDQGVYPPMSTQLEQLGIDIEPGFDRSPQDIQADVYVIGNAISRGNAMLESVLDSGLKYQSGPSVLADYVLPGKWVLGVAGTHGKTSTTAMLAWILQEAGMQPGYLIGGVPQNFEKSASLGNSDFFVVEADEYDTCFDDKRSKFIHYRCRTLILNNLEFDHADIFENLEAIQKQFHHLIRTVPRLGEIIYPTEDEALASVLERGCWTPRVSFGRAHAVKPEGLSDFVVVEPQNQGFSLTVGNQVVDVNWDLLGEHNIANGAASLLAARHVGVDLHVAAHALSCFKGVKRRLEVILERSGLIVYDDFAHHPTAIKTTLDGLRQRYPNDKIIALIEPRSNTMKQGVHKAVLSQSAVSANQTVWFDNGHHGWIEDMVNQANPSLSQSKVSSIGSLVDCVLEAAHSRETTHVVLMSNGSFSGLREKLTALFQESL